MKFKKGDIVTLKPGLTHGSCSHGSDNVCTPCPLYKKFGRVDYILGDTVDVYWLNEGNNGTHCSGFKVQDLMLKETDWEALLNDYG